MKIFTCTEVYNEELKEHKRVRSTCTTEETALAADFSSTQILPWSSRFAHSITCATGENGTFTKSQLLG